jgi:hypothetical protein
VFLVTAGRDDDHLGHLFRQHLRGAGWQPIVGEKGGDGAQRRDLGQADDAPGKGAPGLGPPLAAPHLVPAPLQPPSVELPQVAWPSLTGAPLAPPVLERPDLVRPTLLDPYQVDELREIVKRSARLLAVDVEEDAAEEIARRCRGTPRIANRLLRRVRDYAQVRGGGHITPEVSEAALTLEGIDHIGLNQLDRRFLEVIIYQYGGGPVGIEALAATLQEEVNSLNYFLQ